MKEWLRDTRVQIGGSIVMSLAAFACSPKDTQIRIVLATETPPAAAAPISAEITPTPTVSPTLAPDIPGLHDFKDGTPTSTATATPEPAATAKSTQGSDTPKPTATPTAERTPNPTATPRPTATATPKPEATPTKTPQELDQTLRQQLEVAINQYFFSVNNRNMNVDSVLSNYAQTCADFMAARDGVFEHVCKDQPQIIGIINAGWRGGRVNENIEFQVGWSASVFMDGWEKSVEHNTAMIDNNNKSFGIGCSSKALPLYNRIICVAVFGQ